MPAVVLLLLLLLQLHLLPTAQLLTVQPQLACDAVAAWAAASRAIAAASCAAAAVHPGVLLQWLQQQQQQQLCCQSHLAAGAWQLRLPQQRPIHAPAVPRLSAAAREQPTLQVRRCVPQTRCTARVLAPLAGMAAVVQMAAAAAKLGVPARQETEQDAANRTRDVFIRHSQREQLLR